jgi:hypothetical protein
LKRVGRDAADRASETVRQTGDQVRERASAMVADRKSRLADEVGVFGEALHRAADTLDENDDAVLGNYAHQAGDMIDSCARYLRDANPSEMVRGVSDFTRRHPELVLGGLFLVGVSFARFLKASERHQDRYDFDRDDDFELSYDLDRDVRGFETEDRSAYGDIGRYAGEVPSPDPYATTPTFGTQGVSYSRNEDIPATTSPQPGSYPPSTSYASSTTSGDVSPRLTDETDALGSDVSSKPDPNCPR